MGVQWPTLLADFQRHDVPPEIVLRIQDGKEALNVIVAHTYVAKEQCLCMRCPCAADATELAQLEGMLFELIDNGKLDFERKRGGAWRVAAADSSEQT